jgi:hypothetical protein
MGILHPPNGTLSAMWWGFFVACGSWQALHERPFGALFT